MKSLDQAVSKFKLIKKKIQDLGLSNKQNMKPNRQNSLVQFQQQPLTSRSWQKQSKDKAMLKQQQTERKKKRAPSYEKQSQIQLFVLERQKTLRQINFLIEKKQQLLQDLNSKIKYKDNIGNKSILQIQSPSTKRQKQVKAPNISQIRLETKKKGQNIKYKLSNKFNF